MKHAVLMLNSSCNMKCKHCYRNDFVDRDPEDAVRMVRELKDSGFHVTTAGSEVLLNPRYLKAYEEAGQDYVLTNGILIARNSDMVEIIKDHNIKSVRFSYHYGVSDFIEGPVEDIVKSATEKCNRAGLGVSLGTVIAKPNYSFIEDISRECHAMGAKELKLMRYIPVPGKDSLNGKLELEESDVKYVFSETDRVRGLYDKESFRIRLSGNFGPKKGTKGEELSRRNEYCPAGKDFFSISADNRIYACPFLSRDDFYIGMYEDPSSIKELHLDEREGCIACHL